MKITSFESGISVESFATFMNDGKARELSVWKSTKAFISRKRLSMSLMAQCLPFIERVSWRLNRETRFLRGTLENEVRTKTLGV